MKVSFEHLAVPFCHVERRHSILWVEDVLSVITLNGTHCADCLPPLSRSDELALGIKNEKTKGKLSAEL